MGSVLGSLFGGGESTSQHTEADPVSRAMNTLRYEQLNNLFSISPYSEYSRPAQGGEYNPADISKLTQGLMSIDDYKKLGLDASSNYINQIATPQIMQQAALQGLEGGGMAPEAIAKATAGIALPFIQSMPSAYGQYASQMFPLMDYGRALKEQDLLRRQGVMQTALTGLPYTPGSSTSGSRNQQPMFNWFGQG
jgi:hypothetical protein